MLYLRVQILGEGGEGMGGVSIERVVGRWLSRVTGGGAGPGRRSRPGKSAVPRSLLVGGGEGRGMMLPSQPLGSIPAVVGRKVILRDVGLSEALAYERRDILV